MDRALLYQGILIGPGAAVPIGPVNVEIARRTLRGRFLAGLFLGAGAVTVDSGYAVVSTLGLGHLSNRPIFFWSFLIGGSALFCFLGSMSLREAWRAIHRDPLANPTLPTPTLRGGYVTGLLMTLVNPMTLAFWFVTLPGRMHRVAKCRCAVASFRIIEQW